MISSIVEEGTSSARGPTLRTAPDGRLVIIAGDRSIAVRLRQCFPWSEPGLHLSLRDDEDREVAIVDDPARLDDESRSALEPRLGDGVLPSPEEVIGPVQHYAVARFAE